MRTRSSVLPSVQRTYNDLKNTLFIRRCLACEAMTSTHFCDLCENALMRAPDTCHETFSLGSYWQYGGPFAQAFTRAKFAGHAMQMNTLLQISFDSDFLNTFLERLHANQIQHVSWIPAHPFRRLSRGFQVSQMIAHHLTQCTHLIPMPALQCTRHDAPFSLGLQKNERIQRIKGRFATLKAPMPQRILLIDDVKTTGATLNEAQEQLKKAGAQAWTFTLAQTPAL